MICGEDLERPYVYYVYVTFITYITFSKRNILEFQYMHTDERFDQFR